MTLLAFLIALGLLITVHEWGHYRVAVACGVQVMRFSIGFGRPLVRWTRRQRNTGQDTEFVICLIPLGGYVKMLDGREDTVPIESQDWAFDRKSLWARSAIVVAGPLANLLFAVLLYAATFWLGQYETRAIVSAPVAGSVADVAGVRSGDWVLRVGDAEDDLQDIASMEDLRWWTLRRDANATAYLEVQAHGKGVRRVVVLHPDVSDADEDGDDAIGSGLQALGLGSVWSRPVLGDVMSGQAASQAGLSRGDLVLRIDGRVVEDAASLRAMVRASGLTHEPLPQMWQIQRAGVGVIEVTVTPAWVREPQGTFGRIGAHVGEPPEQIWVQSDLVEGAVKALTRTADMVQLTVSMIGQMLTGRASLDNLSGPITMADFAGRTAVLGLGAYLSYLALLSVSLGVFNLLPLPMLDGGHLMYYLYEAITGRPPAPRWLDVLQRIGLMVLVALMAFALFNDVARLGWWG